MTQPHDLAYARINNTVGDVFSTHPLWNSKNAAPDNQAVGFLWFLAPMCRKRASGGVQELWLPTKPERTVWTQPDQPVHFGRNGSSTLYATRTRALSEPKELRRASALFSGPVSVGMKTWECHQVSHLYQRWPEKRSSWDGPHSPAEPQWYWSTSLTNPPEQLPGGSANSSYI